MVAGTVTDGLLVGHVVLADVDEPFDVHLAAVGHGVHVARAVERARRLKMRNVG